MQCKRYKSNIIVQFPDFELKPKVAAFDLDGTLIKYVYTDKVLLNFNTVVPLLNTLQDYSIVIFTNQLGVSLKKNVYKKRNMILTKIKKLQQLLGIPIEVIIATERDSFRKPNVGMWGLLQKMHKHISIDKTNSFFVGDAAGRTCDISDSDKQFALNINLPFYIPEDFFSVTFIDNIIDQLLLSTEIIITNLPFEMDNYVHTTDIDTIHQSLRCGLSCIIPDFQVEKYIPIADKYKVSIRCFTNNYVYMQNIPVYYIKN